MGFVGFNDLLGGGDSDKVYSSTKTVGTNPEEGNKMEDIKVNILRSLDEEYTTTYRFLDDCFPILDGGKLPSLNYKIAYKLFSAMNYWEEARRDMHNALSFMIRQANSNKESIEKGLGFWASDAVWVTQTGYEKAIIEAQKWEQEITTLTSLIGIDANDRVRLFAKLNSLIKF